MGSQVIAEICLSELAETEPTQATITEFEHLTSYNWLNGDGPTISVPGKSVTKINEITF